MSTEYIMQLILSLSPTLLTVLGFVTASIKLISGFKNNEKATATFKQDINYLLDTFQNQSKKESDELKIVILDVMKENAELKNQIKQMNDKMLHIRSEVPKDDKEI